MSAINSLNPRQNSPNLRRYSVYALGCKKNTNESTNKLFSYSSSWWFKKPKTEKNRKQKFPGLHFLKNLFFFNTSYMQMTHQLS